MKRFLAVVALFLVPVLAVCEVFGLVVYASGEWYTEEQITEMVMNGEPAFFGLAYRDNTRYYKHLVASAKAADLLVLGTSRSMQFHSEFFTTDSFYNAGGGAGYINEFQFFLENLPEDTPMAQRMHLRTMELSEIKDAKLRQQYQRMQKQVALPRKSVTRTQRVEKLSERVERRYEEAKRYLQQNKGTASQGGP